MPSASSEPPLEDVELRGVVDRVLASRGDDVEFIVLFGSRARGNWSPDSDYDLLVGLRVEDGRRLTDRMYDFSLLVGVSLDVEVFPYARSEWQRMFEGPNLLMLDALDHGKVLFDRGAFAEMRRQFQWCRAEGVVVPSGGGWQLVGEWPGVGRPTPPS